MSQLDWSTVSSSGDLLTGGNYSGCLTCPDNHVVQGDQGLGALETLAKNILTKPPRDYTGPNFPLSEMRTKEAKTRRIGGEDGTVHYSVGFPNIEDYAMYDPTGFEEVVDRTITANGICGPEQMQSAMFDLSSIACNPPRGRGMVMGKDFSPITSRMAPLELGPFCVTQFQNFDHLMQIFEQLEESYPMTAKHIMNLHRIREFIDNNRNLAAACAGDVAPDFNPFYFKNRPNSAGNIHWFFEAIEAIVSRVDSSKRHMFKACMSNRIWKHWMRQEAERLGVNIETNLAQLYEATKSYSIYMNDGKPDSLTLFTERSNCKIQISLTHDPVYVIDEKTGQDCYEWRFQPWYVTRPGDDTRAGESAGFVQEKNPDYGRACSSCPDGEASLTEFIMIYMEDESHCYEAYPTNPFRGTAAFRDNVSEDLSSLYGGMEMKYYFGNDVDQYFLEPLFGNLSERGIGCPSNIDNTWFAGRMLFGERTRFMNKYASGVLAVKMPFVGEALEQVACCPVQPAKPDEKYLPKEPMTGPPDCVEVEPVEPGEPGCLRPKCDITVGVPAEGEEIELLIPVRRVEGSTGPLQINWTACDDTAENTTDYLVDAAGTINFPEGVMEACIPVRVPGKPCGETSDCLKFIIKWEAGDGVLCDDACLETEVKLIIPACAVDECEPCERALADGEEEEETETP